jgi:hypothetical protein
MTKRTRYFLIGSAAVLVLGLCIGLVAYYGGVLPSLAAERTGPEELSYIPADATVVAFADVRDVMNSQFRQRVHELIPQKDRGAEEFQKATGIDIERDIDHVVACVIAKEGSDGGLVVARGTFNTGQLEALAREHGGEVTDYKGKRLVRLHRSGQVSTDTNPNLEERGGALAFLKPGVAAIGDEASIKRAIDAALSGQSVTGNDEMMKLVSQIETGANAWAVGRVDALASRAKLPAEVSQKIPPVKWFAATGRVDGGLSGMVRVEATNEESAKNLRDVITGFFALARMQAGSDPNLQGMLQALQLSGSGTEVVVSFSIPVEVIDALAKMARGAK